ncbi:hypothetical protein IED13_03020 [Bosea sp. SSUT16]|uniref:Uncharacterized protein n=1 Tax=Bosea spartocytisi TaxID=2773451 RepID=A0A927E5D6_9HYPH|nr:hypothetical protein [Bosea spartocytisi]MBD3844659.1 hypothetical protein [Bosea spartocytisi]MCT4470862.1 hypothetical protein [Bosea spartocytisi]
MIRDDGGSRPIGVSVRNPHGKTVYALRLDLSESFDRTIEPIRFALRLFCIAKPPG